MGNDKEIEQEKRGISVYVTSHSEGDGPVELLYLLAGIDTYKFDVKEIKNQRKSRSDG